MNNEVCPVCGHKGSAMHFTDDYDHGYAAGKQEVTNKDFANSLALEIWDCWHGPLAKKPGSHTETVEELLEMFERIHSKTKIAT